MNDEFTKSVYDEAIDGIHDIVRWLNKGESIDRDDLHNRLFNEDYFIIGIHQANEALKGYDGDASRYSGAFGAIDRVREYEIDNFGEFTTAIEPEAIVNMLAYIIGEEVLAESETYNTSDSELTIDQLNKIKAELESARG